VGQMRISDRIVGWNLKEKDNLGNLGENKK
jgi:hypothetical protein